MTNPQTQTFVTVPNRRVTEFFTGTDSRTTEILHCCHQAELRTVADLMARSVADLLMKHFSMAAISHISEQLQANGLSLRREAGARGVSPAISIVTAYGM